MMCLKNFNDGLNSKSFNYFHKRLVQEHYGRKLSIGSQALVCGLWGNFLLVTL